MKYVRVDSMNRQPDEPVMLYSELDERRFEIRKVEIFPNFLAGWASVDRVCGPTQLRRDAMPELRDVAKQLEPVEISREEFEWVWNRWVRCVSRSDPRRSSPSARPWAR